MKGKYSDEDEELSHGGGGGFEEEYIDDEYDDVKPKTKAPASNALKNDFWEPPKA